MYAIVKKAFVRKLFIDLILISLTPQIKIFEINKNDNNPIDWRKKSETKLPFVPKRLLTLFSSGVYKKFGSLGE